VGGDVHPILQLPLMILSEHEDARISYPGSAAFNGGAFRAARMGFSIRTAPFFIAHKWHFPSAPRRHGRRRYRAGWWRVGDRWRFSRPSS